MNLCIIGWYGTETIGDRSILLGIFEVYAKKYSSFNVNIGSLYPFLTDRTIFYDRELFKTNNIMPTVKVFDSRDYKMLSQNIKKADHIIIGGGPLMDLDEMQILKYSFRYAKKNNVKTIVFGCGLGPLNNKFHLRQTVDILIHSDLAIFRDSNSLKFAKHLCPNNQSNFFHLQDPAIIPIGRFLKNSPPVTRKGIAINFRKQPVDAYGEVKWQINEFAKVTNALANKFETIYLVPMHTFSIGGDDRIFLTDVRRHSNQNNIKVIQQPLNVFEVYQIYYSCIGCIGMRYHSIAFQVLLNGNNIIIDYTGGINGKTRSFLADIDVKNFYENRIISLQEEPSVGFESQIVSTIEKRDNFHYEFSIFDKLKNDYVTLLDLLE